MRIHLTLVAVGLVACPAWSQIYVPAQSSLDPTEANDQTNYPLMRAQSRSQYVIAATEIGAAAMLTKVTLRYNGPSFGPSGGTLANLDVYLGNGSVAPGQSTAQFDANHSGLTRVAALQNFAFGADTSVNPSPWGGPTGEFVISFGSPFAYTGGNLVLELRANGNSNAGAAPSNALLDAERDPVVGPLGGSTSTLGTGCQGASFQIGGQLAPGGELALQGSGLGASAPVVALIGATRFSLPLGPSAPGCSLHNDILLQWVMLADATGNIAPYAAGSVVPLPAYTGMNGGMLQLQLAAVRPGINPLGIVTSNNVQVTLGSYVPPYRGYFAHHNHLDRNATTATFGAPAVLAMRLN